MVVLVLAIAGACGAPARYVVDGVVQGRTRGVFPWGTFAVNVAGSLLLGVVTGLALWHDLGPVPDAALGTGFCGALTTFSTFGYETMRLVEDGSYVEAAINAAANTALGLLGAAAGLGIAAVL